MVISDYRCLFIWRHSSNIRDSADTRLAIIFPWWCRYWPFVTGEFPSQRPVAWSFDVFFDLRLSKWLSNQSRRRWFETLSRSFKRHRAKHLWLSMILVNFWIRCRLYNDRISRNLTTRVKKYIFASSIFSLVYTQCGEAFIPIMCVFHYISIAIYWLEENVSHTLCKYFSKSQSVQKISIDYIDMLHILALSTGMLRWGLIDAVTMYRTQININSLWSRWAIWKHRSWSTLMQVMACCLTAPSHYPNQCDIAISEVLLYSPEGSLRGMHNISMLHMCLKIINWRLQPHHLAANKTNG